MPKRVISIGFELNVDSVEHCRFDSDISLLDWDIILFKPDLNEWRFSSETYKGKSRLSDARSFQLKELSEHWRREIKDAVENGKTVIIYLPKLVEVYVGTGDKTYSGTGRNRAVTNIVNLYDNYECIPADLNITNRTGKQIKLCPKGGELLSIYWREFRDISAYNVVIESKNAVPCLSTKAGDKTVGAILHSQKSSGAMILLPDIDFYPSKFFKEVEVEGEGTETHWTKAAGVFASRLLSAIISIDKTLKNESDKTPEPEWAKADQYTLNKEKEVRSQLLTTETKLEKLQAKKEALIDDLDEVGKLRWLLYEKGTPLEFSVLEALRVIGFKAENYEDDKSEFDAVFESKEGRLIGEAEGKDNKAINVTKLRQLALNIHEDLEREDIEAPAKGVLFGNAFRLKPLDEREATFTDKCISAAKTTSTALVCTTELFKAAHYLSNNKDANYATSCRAALLETVGKVEFPKIPKVKKSKEAVATA